MASSKKFMSKKELASKPVAAPVSKKMMGKTMINTTKKKSK